MNTTSTLTSTNELTNLWELLFAGVPTPTPAQFGIWLARYDAAIVRQALGTLGHKFLQVHGEMTFDHLIRFASSVMSRLFLESQSRLASDFHRTH